jgi:hypothetical protein
LPGLERETADHFAGRVFEKYYKRLVPDKTADDFVIKAAGLTEFVTGAHLVTSFEFVRKYVDTLHAKATSSGFECINIVSWQVHCKERKDRVCHCGE